MLENDIEITWGQCGDIYWTGGETVENLFVNSWMFARLILVSPGETTSGLGKWKIVVGSGNDPKFPLELRDTRKKAFDRGAELLMKKTRRKGADLCPNYMGD
jgi:hypothetical protein